MDDDGNGKENRTRNIILGVLGGALLVIAVKLLFRWFSGEI